MVRSGGGTLVEYAVGKNGDIFPEGSGKLMKAGAKVRFNMHYHAIGEPIVDRTEVGIVFYPKGVVPKHVITTILSPNQDDLDIPAGADNVRSDAYFKMEKPSHLVGFMPHMHNRGKRQCLEAIYPDMRVEQLNCVNYDFNWQIVYNYADDVAPLLPAGTIMHVISWHDNSAANKYNPDPRNWVGFGNRTTDDMSRHWLTFYTMSDEEFKAEVAERNAKKARATAAMTEHVRRNRRARKASQRLIFFALSAFSAVFSFSVFSVSSVAQIRYATGQNVVPVFEGWERNPDGSVQLRVRIHEPQLRRGSECSGRSR